MSGVKVSAFFRLLRQPADEEIEIVQDVER